jgi:hypothetical protein
MALSAHDQAATGPATRPRAVDLGVQSLTVEGAIEHLVDAATGVVQNELQLATLEAKVTAERLLRGTAMLLVGALLLGGAAVALAMVGYQAFPPDVTPAVRLTIIAGVCVVLGGLLSALGMHRMRTQ